jgi:hypothetical protein
MRLHAPGSVDSLTPALPTVPNLSKLVGSDSLIEEESFRVQQVAVWVITEDPSRGNFMSLGTFGSGSEPSEEELRRIRQIFVEAGIPLDDYRALD